MPTEIEQHYAELKKKLSLPDFGILDKEFEISKIEKPFFLLRAIRRKIGERLEAITQFLDQLLQPDPNSFCSLFEYRCFTESERKELLKQFQSLMSLYRASITADLSADDTQDAAFITKAANEFPAARQALKPLIQKLADCWPKKMEQKDVVGYFG
ncbi:MAG: hypothetical protein QXR48_00090 [Candidatus Woesearchaeota archaeon]